MDILQIAELLTPEDKRKVRETFETISESLEGKTTSSLIEFNSLGLSGESEDFRYINVGRVSDSSFFAYALKGLFNNGEPQDFDSEGYEQMRENGWVEGGSCDHYGFSNSDQRKDFFVVSLNQILMSSKIMGTFLEGHEEAHAYFKCGFDPNQFAEALSRTYNVNSALFRSLNPHGEEIAHLGGMIALSRKGISLDDFFDSYNHTEPEFQKALKVVGIDR